FAVVRSSAELDLHRDASFVTGLARGVRRGAGKSGPRPVRRLFPLLDEGRVHTGVATAARGRHARIHVNAREWLIRGDVGVLDVREPRTVTAFTLHVVVSGIRRGCIAGGMANGVAELGNGMALVAGSGCVSRGLKVGPGTRVLRGNPLSLNTGVAIAARRLLVGDGEVAEEPVRTIGGRIEGRGVAVDDLLLGTCAKREHGQDPDKPATSRHRLLPQR